MMNSKNIRRIYLVCLILSVIMIVAGGYLSYGKGFEGLSAGYIRDIAADAMGILVGGILLLGLFAEKEADNRSHAMFRMIFILIILFFLDTVSSYAEGHYEYVTLIKVVNTLLFIFEDLLGYVYWTYIRNELDIKGKFLNVAGKICLIALYVNIILDILNYWLGIFFTISDTGDYVDSPLEFIGDTAIIAVFILAAIAIFRQKELSINSKLVLISFETFPFIAYISAAVTQEYILVYPAYILSVLFIYIRVFSERGKKIAEQQVVLTKQSTALMISQIQPHFLYNVLTTISNLCATDPEEAEETTVLFSQYLRTNLDSLRNQEAVPFAMELGHIRTYVELEKKRFGDILNVEYDINEQNFKVPSLGLQPIVENSIKHGIRGKNAPGHVKIGTYKADRGYKIIIEDDGIGFDMNAPVKEDGRSHVGMTNVKERLRQMCNATMSIESSPGKGCRTEIIIPEE